MIIPKEYFISIKTTNLLKDSELKNEILEGILTVPDVFPLKKHFSSEKYTVRDCVESLIHYRKKEKIVFDSVSEGFSITFVKDMDMIVKSLIKEYNMQPNDFFYISGSAPTSLNIKAYKDFCKRNNFTQINLVLNNIQESRIRSACNRLNFSKFKFNLMCVSKIKSKKFISLNGVPRAHRIFFTMLLIEKNLLDSGYFSFGLNHGSFKITEEQARRTISYLIPNSISSDLVNRIHDVFVKNYNLFPMTLTKKHDDSSNDIFLDDFKMSNNSYFNLIMETNFFDKEENSEVFNFKETKLLSEKTFRGFAFPIPFVLLNRPYSLAALQEYGYKTFHPFIDETYDTIENDEHRLLAVLKEVERLCNLSDSEWLKMQSELMPILIYNFNKLINSKNYTIVDRV